MKEASILVTGASSGIGRAIVVEGLRRGHRVAACARRADRLAELEEELAAYRDRLELVEADVNDSDAMARWVEGVADRHGIDALINNAGYGHNGAVTELSVDDYRTQFETNFFAVVGLTQQVIPHLLVRGGDIVMISSVLSMLSLPGKSAYGASKWALDGFAHAIRLELKRFGIRVSIVNPGLTATEFATAMTVVGERPPSAPAQGAMSADEVARVTLDCLGRTRRNVPLTLLGRVGILLHRRAPWLLERISERSYLRSRNRSD